MSKKSVSSLNSLEDTDKQGDDSPRDHVYGGDSSPLYTSFGDNNEEINLPVKNDKKDLPSDIVLRPEDNAAESDNKDQSLDIIQKTEDNAPS